MENNGRTVVFRFNGILQASEGAEEVPRGQGRVPPAPLGGPVAPGPWVAPRLPFDVVVSYFA